MSEAVEEGEPGTGSQGQGGSQTPRGAGGLGLLPGQKGQETQEPSWVTRFTSRVERSEEVQGEAGGTAAPGTHPGPPSPCRLGGAGRVLLLLLRPRPGLETETTPSLLLPPPSPPQAQPHRLSCRFCLAQCGLGQISPLIKQRVRIPVTPPHGEQLRSQHYLVCGWGSQQDGTGRLKSTPPLPRHALLCPQSWGWARAPRLPTLAQCPGT